MPEVGLKFDLMQWNRGLTRAGDMAKRVLEDKTTSAVNRAAASSALGFMEGFRAGVSGGSVEGVGEKLAAGIRAGLTRAFNFQDVATRWQSQINEAMERTESRVGRSALRIGAVLVKAFARSGKEGGRWGNRLGKVLQGIGRSVGFATGLVVRLGRVTARAGKLAWGAIRKVGRVGVRTGLAVFGAFAAVGAAIGRSAVRAHLEWEDALTELQGSLSRLGPEGAKRGEEMAVQLAGALQRTMGTSRAETTGVFADFMTRGFDERQARALTQLAVNTATRTGKSLETVVQSIGDAARGNTAAVRQLGVEVHQTGNAVVDGDNAIRALMGAYGEIGVEMANPFDRLRGNVEELRVAVGERLFAAFGPVIEKVSDFVSGLLRSEEGQAALDKIARGIKWVGDVFGSVFQFAVNWFDVVYQSARAWHDGYMRILTKFFGWIADAVAWLVDKIPGIGGGVAKQLRSFARGAHELSDAYEEGFEESATKAAVAFDKAWAGQRSETGEFLDRMIAAGQEEREKDREALTAAMRQDLMQGGFASMEAHRQEAERNRRTGQRTVTATGRGDVAQSQQVAVRIISTRPDRFRRARFA